MAHRKAVRYEAQADSKTMGAYRPAGSGIGPTGQVPVAAEDYQKDLASYEAHHPPLGYGMVNQTAMSHGGLSSRWVTSRQAV